MFTNFSVAIGMEIEKTCFTFQNWTNVVEGHTYRFVYSHGLITETANVQIIYVTKGVIAVAQTR